MVGETGELGELHIIPNGNLWGNFFLSLSWLVLASGGPQPRTRMGEPSQKASCTLARRHQFGFWSTPVHTSLERTAAEVRRSPARQPCAARASSTRACTQHTREKGSWAKGQLHNTHSPTPNN